MAKVLADLIKIVEGISSAADVTVAQDAANALLADLKEYDESYNNELKKKNSEARGLRDRVKGAESLQTTLDGLKTNHSKILKTLGLDDDVEDLETALASVAEKILLGENAGKGKTELDKQLSDLQKQLTTLTKDLAKVQTEKAGVDTLLANEKGKRQTATKTQALMDALTEHKAIKPKELMKILTHSVQMKDDDSLVYIDDKGEEIEVSKGVQAWLTANPEFVTNTQNPGSGSGGAGGGGTGKLKATNAQMKDPAWYEKNRQAVLENRVEITD